MTSGCRFATREGAASYAAEARALASTPTETVLAALVGQWARWHYRWRARPTNANDLREQLAWDRLRFALAEAEMEDTWLDPSS